MLFSVNYLWTNGSVQESLVFSRKLKEKVAVRDGRQGTGLGSRRPGPGRLENCVTAARSLQLSAPTVLVSKMKMENLCQNAPVLWEVRVVVTLVGEGAGVTSGAAGLLGCCQGSQKLGIIYMVVLALGKFLRLHVSNDLCTFLVLYMYSSIKNFPQVTAILQDHGGNYLKTF